MLNQYLYVFLLLLIYSGSAVTKFKITKVQTSSRKAIMVSDINQTASKGDELLLLGDDSKCLVVVLKSKGPTSLISTKQCRFKIKVGNTVLDQDFFEGDANLRRDNASSPKVKNNLLENIYLELELGFEIEKPLKIFTYPLENIECCDSVKVDKKNTSSLEGKVALYSSRKREFGILFGYGRSLWKESYIVYKKNSSEVEKTVNYKYFLSGGEVGIEAAPIISRIRIRPFLGFAFLKGSIKEETFDEKTKIKGDAIAYGIQYDIDSTRKDSFVQFYFSDFDIDYEGSDIKTNIESKELTFSLRKEIKGRKKRWLEISYGQDREESDEWKLSSSFRNNWMIFSLSYRKEAIDHPDYDTEKTIGAGVTFYFGNKILD